MIRRGFTILLTLLMSMMGIVAFAYNAKVDGIYYNFSGTEATVTYLYSGISSNRSAYSSNVVIPEAVTYNGTTYSVTSIGSCAFYYCSGLTSVTIPNSVTSIGERAFYYCSGLTSVTIPNSVTSIGDQAFYNCSGLSSVTIPNSVTSIGNSAFYYCSGLTSVTIPNSVTSIGGDAFYNCSRLTSIKIPATDFSAFCRVVNLVNSNIRKHIIMIDADDNEITEYVIPDGVTSIGDNVFYYCSGLTSVTIPNSVSSIGNSAFSGCI